MFVKLDEWTYFLVAVKEMMVVLQSSSPLHDNDSNQEMLQLKFTSPLIRGRFYGFDLENVYIANAIR